MEKIKTKKMRNIVGKKSKKIINSFNIPILLFE